MRAAVVSTFDRPPRYEEFPNASPSCPRERVVEVLAAALSQRVRSQADGTHYTSGDKLPLVPGIDGVGRDAAGTLRYFILPDTPWGSMAERTVIDLRRSIELPPGTDPVAVAAAMNPAMSSWVALRLRTGFAPGQRVLVLGATGNAGQIALQVAKSLGAAHVSGAGRNPVKLARLTDLGADAVIDLAGPDAGAALAAAGAEVDVVLDYLWGRPAADALDAIVPARRDDGQQLTWIQIGSVAGPEAPIPSAALRATHLQILGSGQGSVSTRAILAELPALAAEVSAGRFTINARPVALERVEQAWAQFPTTADRLVLTP